MMGENTPHIMLRLSTKEPIELKAFVTAFTSLGHEYERFIRIEHPEMVDQSEIYIKQIREGSIEAELWNYAMLAGGFAISQMDQLLILEQFVKLYGARLSSFFIQGGRLNGAAKNELADFMGQVTAIANDPQGSAEIAAAVYEDGERKIKAAVIFRTPQAKTAVHEIENQRREMENKSNADHQRVLMRFVRPSIEPTKAHRRTGQRAMVDAIHDKPLSVVYVSDMARERVDHEMKEADGNVFRLLFDVDVNVEYVAGKPIAYRVMAVHDITDLPDEEAA
jgi:hypothetical protein